METLAWLLAIIIISGSLVALVFRHMVLKREKQEPQ
jgi:hypothetical protein